MFFVVAFSVPFLPTGQVNPGRGWLVLSLFLLLLDFPLPFFILFPAPRFFAFASIFLLPFCLPILPSYLHVLFFFKATNPILDRHRGLPKVQIDI